MKKLIYFIIGGLSILLVLAAMAHKSVHSEKEIQASPEIVWKVLTETDQYPEWNPVMKVLGGSIQEGQKVNYQFTQDEQNVSEISAKVEQVLLEELLNQRGGIPLVLTFDHKYQLEPAGSATKMTIHEDYRGIAVLFWNPKPVEEAYERLNTALKERAEKHSK